MNEADVHETFLPPVAFSPETKHKKVLTKREIFSILLEKGDYNVEISTIRAIEKAILRKLGLLAEGGDYD